MLELVFVQGSDRGRVVPLTFQKAWFGRQPTCDIVLQGDGISRVHFGIVRRGAYYVLIDNKSTNGTVVNRVQATEVTLCAGDQISAGDQVILVREASAEPLGFRFVAEWLGGDASVQVFPANTVLLGRQNICQIQLNEPAVAAVHAELERRPDGIWISDKSSGAGVYVNGQRVVNQQLRNQDRIRISPFEIVVSLRDDMCALLVHMARTATTSHAALPENYREVVKAPEERPGEALPSSAIAGLPIWLQEKAPIWVPTSDILPNRFQSKALLAALLAVLGCVGVAWAAGWHGFYAPGAVSKFHTALTCSSCHPGFAGVSNDACRSCHSDVLPAKVTAAEAHARKGVGCTSCHSEHRGVDAAIQTNVGDGCQAAGCHVTVHKKQKAFLAGKTAPRSRIPPAVAFEARFGNLEKDPEDPMHLVHGTTTQGNCASCHTDGDPKIAISPEEMRIRCLACHGFGPEATLRSRCYSCHFEHATATQDVLANKLRFYDANFGDTGDLGGLGLLLAALTGAPLLYFGAMAVNFRREQRSSSARTIASLIAPRGTPAEEERAPRNPGRSLTQVILAQKVLREFLKPKPQETPPSKANIRPRIDLDLCVGCAACVHVCPFNVLEIVNEKAIAARLDDCTGYSACAAACPTEAIQLVTGGPARTMELPVFGENLETNVPGLYLAGEVTGKALIKVAINQGRTVVDSILKNRPFSVNGYDLIVVGAGPAGISTSLAARSAGLNVLTLEQGSVANTIRNYPRQKFVMAEPVSIPVYGPLFMQDSSKESLLERWDEMIAKTGLKVRQEERVLSVAQRPGEFLLKTTKGEYIGARVVLAIGRRGSPRKLGVPGEDSTKVTYNLLDAEAYRKKAICVVGGGDSGIEAANGLARADLENRVSLVHREENFSASKPRNQTKIQTLMEEGRIQAFLGAAVVAIGEHSVKVKVANAIEEIQNDFVFVMIGGENPKKFLSDCRIQFSQRPLN